MEKMLACSFDDGDFIDEFEQETFSQDRLISFLLGLNMGFSFAGKQVCIVQREQDFIINLLFYHIKLRCFVVVEFKTGQFLPGYTSLLNGYCKLVDENLKCKSDNNTIGLLICKYQDEIVTEYSIPGNHLVANLLDKSLPTKEQVECCFLEE